MTGPRRVHRGYVSRTKTTGGVRSGDVVVTEWSIEFQAFCHGCRWAGDVTAYELARQQARAHSDRNQPREGGTTVSTDELERLDEGRPAGRASGGRVVTAVPVCHAAPNTEEWHRARRLGVGGSEIGTLLGYNPWQTPLELWQVKTGRADGYVGNFATRRGHHLEAFLIGEYEHAHPGTFVQTPADGMPSVFALDADSVVRCSLDGIAHDRHGDHLVEVKTASGRQSPKWDGGALPDAYTAQVVWQLGVMGMDRAVVVADVAGDFTERTVYADPGLFTQMVEYAQWWWDAHVTGDVMPEPDPVRDAERLAGLWTPDPDRAVTIDGDLAAQLHQARAEYTAAKQQLDVATARVQCAMTTACTAVDDGGTVVATWNPTRPRASVDVAALRAERPDIADTYTRHSQPGRRFTVKTSQGKGAWE